MNTSIVSDTTLSTAQQFRQIEQTIALYATFVMAFPGLLLNAVNIFMFNRKAFTKNMRFFYTCESLFDMLNLVYCILTYLPIALNQSLITQSHFACKFISFTRRFASHAPSWILVIITFDRVIGTFYSVKYKSMFGIKYMCLSVSTTLALLFATSTLNLVFTLNESSSTTGANNRTTTLRECVAPRHLGLLVNVSAFLIRAIVPFLIMFTFNLVLIYKLFWHKSQISRLNKKEYHFAFTIIAFNYIFLFLNLPMTIQQLYEYWPTSSGDEHRALMRFLQVVGGTFMYSFSACTFFFHLRFNVIYKREMRSIFKQIFNNRTNSFNNQANSIRTGASGSKAIQ
jgi:hypothetical protein